MAIHPQTFNDLFCYPNLTNGLSVRANMQQGFEQNLQDGTLILGVCILLRV
jgi:hypothetical protein